MVELAGFNFPGLLDLNELQGLNNGQPTSGVT
jgi:hypothetical protein